METKITPKVWMSARQAAAYVGIAYPKFTALATRGLIPRTKVPGTVRTYRYNRGRLDSWMLENQEA